MYKTKDYGISCMESQLNQSMTGMNEKLQEKEYRIISIFKKIIRDIHWYINLTERKVKLCLAYPFNIPTLKNKKNCVII